MTALERLLAISSKALCSTVPSANVFQWLQEELGEAALQLTRLLTAKNGFFAFESALLVQPSDDIDVLPGLREWNDLTGWRKSYDCIPPRCVFFAQDLFACQFGITPAGLVRLDTETGDVTNYADDLDRWAQRILSNYDYETGWSLGRNWQRLHGPLKHGSRLLGRKPFVLGGSYVVENLVAVDATDAIEKLAELYSQIKDVPDGSKVTVRNWD